MKRIIMTALMALTLLSLTPLGMAHAVEYPAEGTCTGDGVRLRSAPSAKGTQNVVGKLDKGDVVLVFGEVLEDGDRWFQVIRPDGKGKAWVSGRYLEVGELSPVERMLRLIAHDFPKSPKEAQARFGAPRKQDREEVGDFTLTTMIWARLDCAWLDGDFLQSVEMRGPIAPGVRGGEDLSFGGVRLGDPEQKVIDILGKPESRSESELSYHNDAEYLSYISFGLQDGRVVKMHYFYSFH